MSSKTKGGSNRKKGRNIRSPSMQRYKAENRAAKNKARRIAKAKAGAKKAR